MEDKDGGMAFPTRVFADPEGKWGEYIQNGMTMRQYYAAHALQGLLASGRSMYKASNEFRGPGTFLQDEAFSIADSMIAAERVK